MSIDRSHMGRATLFVVMMALSGAPMAQSAGQAPQQPATPPASSGNAPPGEQRVLDQAPGTPLRPGAPAPGSAKDAAQSDAAAGPQAPTAAGPAPGASAGESSP